MKNLVTADTRAQMVLRIRPLAGELFEKRGVEFWGDLERPLRDLFRRARGGALEDFLEELDGLPVPAADCWWQDLPAANLLDYLTQDHRDFLLNFVIDIDAMLDVHSVAEPELAPDLQELRGDFREFAAALRGEMEDEETRLFPRILRYEACLRDPRVHPEFQQGSLQLEIANRSGRFSAQRRETFPLMLSQARRFEAARPENPGLSLLANDIEQFDARLEVHERLEVDSLFPMALEMERTLYNLSIDGTHASPRVRGPMDSGIMRLRSR